MNQKIEQPQTEAGSSPVDSHCIKERMQMTTKEAISKIIKANPALLTSSRKKLKGLLGKYGLTNC